MITSLLLHSLWVFALAFLMTRIFTMTTKQLYALLPLSMIVLLLIALPSPALHTLSIDGALQGSQGLPIYLVGLYFAGAFWQLIRYTHAWWRTEKLAFHGEVVENGWIRSILDEIIAHWGIQHRIELKLSRHIQVPMVIGALKPIILFPVALINHLDQKQVEAILVHELRHIVQHDYLWNLVMALFEVVFFFNPFVYLLHNKIRLQRELECDQAAAEYVKSPFIVAKTLLDIEEFIQNPELAMSIQGRGELTHRVTHLTDPKTTTSAWTVWLGLCLFMMVAMGSSKPVKDISFLKQKMSMVQDSIFLPDYERKIISLEFKTVKGQVKDVMVNDALLERVTAEQIKSIKAQSSPKLSSETNKEAAYEQGLLKKFKHPEPVIPQIQEKKDPEIMSFVQTNTVDLAKIEGYQYGKSKAKQTPFEEKIPQLSSLKPMIHHGSTAILLDVMVLGKERKAHLLLEEKTWMKRELTQNNDQIKDEVLLILEALDLIDPLMYDVEITPQAFIVNGVMLPEQLNMALTRHLQRRYSIASEHFFMTFKKIKK